MHKQYVGQNVYEATSGRLDFLFSEFDNIVISFSGGKDSGLLLNLVLDYAERVGIDMKKRISVFHQDFEAQYSYTTDFVTRTFERLRGKVGLYWVCLPMATRTALGNYEAYWYPWDDTKEELWIRPMPTGEYVINLQNNPITTYTYKMTQENLGKQFGKWYSETHEGKTAVLLGTRADESLARYNAVINKKYGYKGQCYITSGFRKCWTASPIYDWSSSDVWAANYRFGYDYNKIYDLYYKAGVPVDKIRVASPFNEYAVESLNLYRVIEPATWNRLLGRVFRLFQKLICTKVNPQRGADGIIIAFDKVADHADVAATVDKGSITLIAARRPQQPKAVAFGAIDIRSTSNRILGRFAFSCAIGAEILICFGNA